MNTEGDDDEGMGTFIEDEEIARDYHERKQKLEYLNKLNDTSKNYSYKRNQELLPFDQREIPITDDDVYRLGGTMVNEEDDDFWISFKLT